MLSEECCNLFGSHTSPMQDGLEPISSFNEVPDRVKLNIELGQLWCFNCRLKAKHEVEADLAATGGTILLNRGMWLCYLFIDVSNISYFAFSVTYRHSKR